MHEEEWQWWAGRSKEWMDLGAHNTRDDAIAEGINDIGEGEGDFVILEAVKHGIPPIDADRAINDYFEWLNDSTDLYSGENGGPEWTLPMERQKEAEAELQAMLNTWSAKWLTGYIDPEPDMFAATRNMETIRNTRDPDTEPGGHDNPRGREATA